MPGWKVIAEGLNIWDLQSVVADFELKKGDKVKIVMDLKFPIGFIFDVAGAELLFKPFTPEGMDLIDVYGEGSTGIVDMEADPAWLLGILVSIKAHWIALTISGFLLTSIIASIIILAKIAVAPALPVTAMVIGGTLAVVGILAAVTLRKK